MSAFIDSCKFENDYCFSRSTSCISTLVHLIIGEVRIDLRDIRRGRASNSWQAMVRHVKFAALVIVGLLLRVADMDAQQQPSPQTGAARQSLDDAWWTGPLLAPSAATLPRGHVLIEPYVYDATTQGFYNSSGARVSAPHSNGFGSLTYINYGLANKFTVGLIPTFGYNDVSAGLNSAGIGLGDLTVQAQYRISQFHEGRWIPTTSINVQETFPTGRYDQLGSRPSDGFGAGACTTTLGLFSQTFFWLPNGRILRARFNLTQAFSNNVNVQDVSVYGTEAGFRGHANPGSTLLIDAAGEYSVTRSWVLALDAIYRHQGNTAVAGYNILDANQPVQLNSGFSQEFGFAPAIEYNWKRSVGVIFGARLIGPARNTARTITPVMAVNYVH